MAHVAGAKLRENLALTKDIPTRIAGEVWQELQTNSCVQNTSLTPGFST